MHNVLLWIGFIIGITGLVVSLKQYLGPDIPIHDSPFIDAFVPPVECEQHDTIDD